MRETLREASRETTTAGTPFEDAARASTLGLTPKELGMNKHVVRPTSVIDWSTSVVGATA